MGLIPAAVERLAAEFGRLPGIGPKTAQRLTFHCMSATPESTQRLAGALRDLHDGVRACRRCFFIADDELCAVCSNPRRDRTLLCVVEEPLDVLAVERSGEFGGVYHVLGGALSPIDGVGPDQLRIEALERRLDDGEVSEVVIATDPDVEGEATAHYLGERLASREVVVSRLAHGLPAGADLQYADEVTVARAFAGRRLV
ncbi:MAG: recombination protein RecR [Candidatus Dormibacteraeota bacterium]|uniref:Recombination protein RecR n=1 Tax=Candidatus Amunia macphersoniae TaxID=3127014 RepID=A0A934KPR7_9BACT|nr:recombination protein RecR [Candidatus Dormibacteraeota bacterium]